MWPERTIKHYIFIPAEDIGWEQAHENFWKAHNIMSGLALDIGYSDRKFMFEASNIHNINSARLILNNAGIYFEEEVY